MSVVPFVADTAAARTIARRLGRVGLADSDNQTTAAWINDLALYEALQAKEQRVALYLTAGRVIDRETGEVTIDQDAIDEAAWSAFVAALAPWRAHADEGRAMLNFLDNMLRAIAALPVEDEVRFTHHAGIWIGLRHGPVKRPLPPSVKWRWPHSFADQEHEGFRHAIACRQRYRILAEPAKRAAIEAFGLVERAQIDPLWHGIWPTTERDELDQAADAAGVCKHWTLFNVAKRRKQSKACA